MEIIGKTIGGSDIITIYYDENENYHYDLENVFEATKSKRFKTNGMINAFAKVLHDLGRNNIDLTECGDYWNYQYSTYQKAYEGTKMEHACGLSCKYNINNLINSKEKKLKIFKSYRNYYSIAEGSVSEEIDQLVKLSFMREYKPCFYEITWKGYYWLECKYDIKITNQEYVS